MKSSASRAADILSITAPGGATDCVRWAIPSCSPMADVPPPGSSRCRRQSPTGNSAWFEVACPRRHGVGSRPPIARFPHGCPNEIKQRRKTWSSETNGAPKMAVTPSPVNLVQHPHDDAPHLRRADDELGHELVKPLRPTAASMSIEWALSANRTVACLYSADSEATTAPH